MMLSPLIVLTVFAQQGGWHHREVAPHPDPPVRDGLWILAAPKGSSTFIKRLADDGQLAWGDCWSPDASGKRHDLPALWRRGRPYQLLPLPTGFQDGSVSAVSPNGHLAAGRGSAKPYQAVLVWTDRGGATEIRQDGPQAADMRPVSISDDGTVVCEVQGDPVSWIEFRPGSGWHPTTEPPKDEPPNAKAFELMPGWANPTVSALSPNRRYATGSVDLPDVPTHRTQAALWDRTVPLHLIGYPFFRNSDSYAAQGTQVSDDGQLVIGRTYVPTDAPQNGPDWVWRPGKGAETIQSLVQVYGAPGLHPDRRCTAQGMDPDGRFVYGSVDTEDRRISASFVLRLR